MAIDVVLYRLNSYKIKNNEKNKEKINSFPLKTEIIYPLLILSEVNFTFVFPILKNVAAFSKFILASVSSPFSKASAPITVN